MKKKESTQLTREQAVALVAGIDESKITEGVLAQFPNDPDVIRLGGYQGDLIKYVADYEPKNIQDIERVLETIPHKVLGDNVLSNNQLRANCHYIYRDVIYPQYKRVLSTYKGLSEFVGSESVRLWFDVFQPKIRQEALPRIKKEFSQKEYEKVVRELCRIYDLSPRELDLLTYFCSHCKTDIDASKNVCLWIWSQEQGTGKTTIAQYISAFLNGENDRNIDEFNSKIEVEMQIKSRFSIPKATINACTMLDEISLAAMQKNYTDFKNLITQRGCDVEYKFVSGIYPKKANFKYICTSNYSPEFAIADNSERRIVTIEWKRPLRELDFKQIKDLWWRFVLECNWDLEKLDEYYDTRIKASPQVSDVQRELDELAEYLTPTRIECACESDGRFNVLRVQQIPEIARQNFSRKFIREALTLAYGIPDARGRWNLGKLNPFENDLDKDEEAPF